MRQFKDAEGVTWDVTVTLGTLRDIEQSIGRPVLEMIGKPEAFRSQVLGSAEVVAKGLYFACREQAERRGIGYGPFANRLTGPALQEALLAFYQSLSDCFPTEEAGSAGRPTPRRSPGRGRRFMAWLLGPASTSRGPTRQGS